MILHLKHLIILLCGSLTILLSSCYQDLDLEDYRPEQTLVLNAAVSCDTIVAASVSLTQFYTDIRNHATLLNDADVWLSVNGIRHEQMNWSDIHSQYVSSYRPLPGDLIKIEAHRGGQSAWAEDYAISAIPIEKLEVSMKKSEQPTGQKYHMTPEGLMEGEYFYDNIFTYKITFTDTPGIDNYYCIGIYRPDWVSLAELIDFSHDPIFVAQQEIIDSTTSDGRIYGEGGRTFNDSLIDGQTYTLTIVEQDSESSYKSSSTHLRKVVLYSLSESYYKYLTSILNYADDSATGNLQEFGFSEPTRQFTNISGGVGILGMIGNHNITIDVGKFLPKE